MHILVVDEDIGLQEYYTNLMEAEFSNVDVKFQLSAKKALDYTATHTVDIVITETSVGDMNIFDFLETLHAKHLPVIVVSSEATERMIVETMKSGALDFTSKNNIKLGLLPGIITRAVLEADRWAKIEKLSSQYPHRPEYLNANTRVRNYLHEERMEIQRNDMVHNNDEQENIFLAGKSYYVIYLYLQLVVPESVRESMDERKYLQLQTRLLDKFIKIIPRHGGNLWTRKEDSAFFAFKGGNYLPALISALEIRAASRLTAITLENTLDSIGIRIGMAGSKTTYREDKSQIYSEGLNLSAHLAIYFQEIDSIIITSEIYKHLNPRTRKFFFRVPDKFEGHTIYRYEYIS